MSLAYYPTPTVQLDLIEDTSIRIVDWHRLKRLDPILLILMGILVVIGWINMYSAVQNEDYSFFYRHILIFFLTFPLLLFVTMIDYRFIIGVAPILYMLSICGLILVLLFGSQVKGSERWIPIGPFRFQPSELNKIILVLMLTWYFGKLGTHIRKMIFFLITFILTGIPMVLVLLQPNLGTAVSLIPITLAMLWVAGCRVWHWFAVIITGLLFILFLFIEVHSLTPEKIYAGEHPPYLPLKPHQLMRVYTFFYPEADIKGGGWQTYQSRITIGSGGLYGKGLKKGTQTRLKYLPEHHTDFIFSLFAEEHGFIKSSMLIFLYLCFLLRCLQLAFSASEKEGRIMIVGITTIFIFHIFVNIAITMGMLPVTGLPLPFLSYGRSFYFTCMIGIGLICSVPKGKSFLFSR